jgi:hypothetical protein
MATTTTSTHLVQDTGHPVLQVALRHVALGNAILVAEDYYLVSVVMVASKRRRHDWEKQTPVGLVLMVAFARLCRDQRAVLQEGTSALGQPHVVPGFIQ